jgi:hypothetical protein
MQLVHAGAGPDPTLWSPPDSPSLGAREVTLRLLANPIHVALLVIAMSALASTAQWLTLFAVSVVDVLLIRTLAQSRSIRRMVSHCEMSVRARERCHERLLLRAAMSERHRNELASLEAIADALHREISGDAGGDALTDELGIDRLLATYVSLAVAHREGEEMLQMVPAPRGPSENPARGRRNQAEARARTRLAEMSRQISDIADLIVAIHESTIAPADLVERSRRQVADALCTLEAIDDVDRDRLPAPGAAHG